MAWFSTPDLPAFENEVSVTLYELREDLFEDDLDTIINSFRQDDITDTSTVDDGINSVLCQPESTSTFDDDVLDIASEVCLVSPHCSIKSFSRSQKSHTSSESTSTEASFSSIPQSLDICGERFEEDAEYRSAVTYMFGICADGVLEDVYESDEEYRAAIAVVLSPSQLLI